MSTNKMEAWQYPTGVQIEKYDFAAPLMYQEIGYCRYCSTHNSWTWHSGFCPKIKNIEYYPDGTIKKVELR